MSGPSSDNPVVLKPSANMDDKKDDSNGYARLREDTSRPSATSALSPCSSWKHQLLIGCVLLVLFTLCGLLGGIISLRVHLQLSSSNLMQTEGQVSAYENVITNLTTILSNSKGKTQVDTESQVTSISNGPSTVYIHWGASSCPKSAELIYEGVTASGGSQKAGGGSNHLCMTSTPDFLAPQAGRQSGRSHIYGSEYRNAADFEPLVNLHGHDAPCAACLVRRNSLLMVPGASICPTGGNWTREYYGYLMAARSDLTRTEYICVDSKAESVPGSRDEYAQGDILFPVEGWCNQNAGGGLPCSPYVDGSELTCVVCTI